VTAEGFTRVVSGSQPPDQTPAAAASEGEAAAGLRILCILTRGSLVTCPTTNSPGWIGTASSPAPTSR